ncbi:ribonuclease H-like domain-containing protein [Tanacetum coccineum]
MFLSQMKYATEVLERAHMLTCALQYLTFTRPNISYAVQQVCLFMHDPREPYLSALKRILRYIRGTLDYGLQLYSSSTSSLVAYSDVDWLVALLRAGPPLVIVFFWATIFYLGLLSVNSCFLDLVLKLSIEVLLTLLLKPAGYHQRTKHIEIDIHFVRDLVSTGHVRVLHVPSRYQMADIFTKGLPTVLFDDFRSSLSV